MAKPKAVLDTDVIVLLLSQPEPDEDPALTLRREAALHVVATLRPLATFVVPTPVLVELSRDMPGGEALRVALRHLSEARTAPLGLRAAEAAGQMLRTALRERGPGESRDKIKFDALIAGTAHALGARWLVTENGKDFRRHLLAVGSTVELVVPREVPEGKGAQATIFQRGGSEGGGET